MEHSNDASLLANSIRSAFPLLTKADVDLFIEIAVTITYSKNDLVLRQEENRQALFVILSGAVRALRDLDTETVANMSEGEVFGEISFVDNRGATLSIIADEDCVFAVVEGFKLSALLQTVPGLSGRFYHSLALVLARRVRHLMGHSSTTFSWG